MYEAILQQVCILRSILNCIHSLSAPVNKLSRMKYRAHCADEKGSGIDRLQGSGIYKTILIMPFEDHVDNDRHYCPDITISYVEAAAISL